MDLWYLLRFFTGLLSKGHCVYSTCFSLHSIIVYASLASNSCCSQNGVGVQYIQTALIGVFVIVWTFKQSTAYVCVCVCVCVCVICGIRCIIFPSVA
jgi:hypothetical protein